MALGLGVAIATGQGVAAATPGDAGASSESASSSDSDSSSADSSPSKAGDPPSGSTSKSSSSSDTSATADASSPADASDETASDDPESETPAPTNDEAPETPPTTSPAPETADVATVPATEAGSAKDSDRTESDPVQPVASVASAPTATANRSAGPVRATTPEPLAGNSDGGVELTSSAAPQTISTTPSVARVSVAAPTSLATQTAPTGPFDSLVSDFLSLIAAPFLPGGLMSGGSSTPANPFGSLLELVFAAQRRFFFNQPPIAQSVQTAPAAERIVNGTVVAVDPEGDPLSYSIDRPPASGSVTINAAGEFVYTPNTELTLTGGTDTFGVVVRDNGFSLRNIFANVLSVFGQPTDSFGTPVNVSVTVLPASPPPTGPVVFAVTNTGQLISFAPTTPQTVLSSKTITGLSAGETVAGIDYRPANGRLYALSTGGKLYTLNEVTGAATPVSTLAADPTDPTAPFSALTGGATFGIDFNPVPDRLRVIEDVANLRINVDTGATTTDSNLVPVGDYFAAAYTNSFPMPPNTALYALDATANTLVSIGSVPAMAGACPGASGNPNCGVVSVIGPLNVDAGNVGGFDIAGPTNNFVLAAFQVGSGGTSSLYRIDLTTGEATLVGGIGTGTTAPVVTGLAIRAS